MKFIGFSQKGRFRILATGLLLGGIIVAYSNSRNYRKMPESIPVDHNDYEISTEPGYLCLGYLPDSKKWGEYSANPACPKGYAIVANTDSAGNDHLYGPANYVPLTPHCCRLPFDDILTDRNIENVTEACPENSVATSGMNECGSSCTMRCTYINTKKYVLGPEVQALYVADPEKTPHGGRGTADYLSLLDVPLALRWVVFRDGFSAFSNDGCIGSPFGSVLVRKSAKECSGYFYRQLFYKDGTVVPVVPHCDAISDIFDPNAKCLVKKKQ